MSTTIIWEKMNLDGTYSVISEEEKVELYANWFGNFMDDQMTAYQAALDAQTLFTADYTGDPDQMPMHELWVAFLDKFLVDNNLRYTSQ